MKPTDDVSQFPENGMSTTPRTDEQTLAYRTEDGSEMVHASFAAELETELAAEREKVRVLRGALERRHTEQGYHRQYVDDVLDATKEASK